MQVEVSCAQRWFDVVGSSLVADGPQLQTRPTVVALHGGPAGYDHAYLRPHLDRLADRAQVVYVDLPGHAGGLLLQATAARHDLPRILEGFRTRFGDDGPTSRPDDDTYARVIPNPGLQQATPRLAGFDVVAELHRIQVPTLITVGALDPVTPVTAAREISDGVATAPCHLEILDDAGHFPWLDNTAGYWPPTERFITTCALAG